MNILKAIKITIYSCLILSHAYCHTGSISKIRSSNRNFSWMDEQIKNDFKNVKKFSNKQVEDEFRKISSKHKHFNLFKIKHGKISGPDNNIKNFLENLAKLYQLPDCSFIVFRQDILRSATYKKLNIQVPVFASAKDNKSDGKIIHFIDWYYKLMENGKDLGWDTKIEQVNSARHNVSWSDKKPILFWRGAPTNKNMIKPYNMTKIDRGILVDKSQQNPDLIDATFHCLLNKKVQSHYPRGSFASVSDHLSYKYQIAMDGVTATFPGYQWRLYSGCVTIKQASTDTMWYYGALKPWVHYVPVAKNLDGLEDLIVWLRENDEFAEQIAINAYEFTENNLKPEHMYLYAYKVLWAYALAQNK